ncbi:hypothetical protein SCUCBS95973_005744 [Sporothrix curviconia]|uniref:BHLH domain-containing protein n=1 Tax=Sporothrix curviconia TaxID=1260050 RepID=A0ABP0BZE4_9PEZI
MEKSMRWQVWGTESELASTTFTPGVYLHNRDAAYGYLDPRDTTGLTDWTKGVANSYDPVDATTTATTTTATTTAAVAATTTVMDVAAQQIQYLSTASPGEMRQQSLWPMNTENDGPSASSSTSSSFIMAGDTTTMAAIPPPSIAGRVRPTAPATTTTTGPLKPSRVAKHRPKPVGGSRRPSRHNSDHSQYSQSHSDDQTRSFSSASSSASPPVDETPRRHRPIPARLSIGSGSGGGGGGGGGIAGGLLTTGHGGNHNVTLRTASRKPKTNNLASAKTSSSSTTTAAASGSAVTKTESPNSDASRGLSPSSPDGSGGGGSGSSGISGGGGGGGSGGGPTENLTSEERRARQNHNIVEKQYRNRLNTQFTRLLKILPANQVDMGSDVGRSLEFDDRRMSKAEVLELARRRIHSLEDEIQKLHTESESLRSNVQTLNMAIQNGQQMQQLHQQQLLQQHNEKQSRMSITI